MLSQTGLGLAQAPCSDCHNCAAPTAQEPCLPECARLIKAPEYSDYDPALIPKTVVLDQLVERYEAVIFDHERHAAMSTMGGGNCRLCHHDTSEHEIGCCCDCHPATNGTSGPGHIDLKAAYHRQCMFCHRDWSGEADCVICHAPLDAKDSRAMESDVPRDETHAFAHRDVPKKVQFETEYLPGPYVTFDHDVHEAHKVECRECHAQDACASCHLGNGNGNGNGHKADGKQNGHQLHTFSNRSTCTHCHEMDLCRVCHARQPDRVFSHDLTGWPLSRFHNKLECESCHGDRTAHGTMPRDCGGCHHLWEKEGFDHAVAIGVDLGEEHEDMDCVDCHGDMDYDHPPVCNDCHDDDRGPDLLK